MALHQELSYMVCGLWYSERILLNYCVLGVKCFVNFMSQHQFFSLAFPGLVFHGSVPFSFILSNGTPISSILFLTTHFFVALPKFCLHFHFSSSFGIVFSDFLLPNSYLLTVLSPLFTLSHHFLPGLKSSMAFSFT